MINRSRMRDVGDTRSDYEELDSAISAGLYLKDGMNRYNEHDAGLVTDFKAGKRERRRHAGSQGVPAGFPLNVRVHAQQGERGY